MLFKNRGENSPFCCPIPTLIRLLPGRRVRRSVEDYKFDVVGRATISLGD